MQSPAFDDDTAGLTPISDRIGLGDNLLKITPLYTAHLQAFRAVPALKLIFSQHQMAMGASQLVRRRLDQDKVSVMAIGHGVLPLLIRCGEGGLRFDRGIIFFSWCGVIIYRLAHLFCHPGCGRGICRFPWPYPCSGNFPARLPGPRCRGAG